MRSKLTYRALGARRQVHVLDGECFAVRREYWVGVLDRYLNQRFWGVRPVSGDDGWITTLLLEDGWQTAYQENARVHTYAPASFGVLLRQQLRWTRNSVRRSWYVLSRGVAFRTGAPFTVHTLAYLLKAPTFAALLVLALGRSFGQWQLGSDGVNSAQQLAVPLTEASVFSGGIAGLAALVTGLTLTKVIRGIPRYQRGRLTVDLLLVARVCTCGTFASDAAASLRHSHSQTHNVGHAWRRRSFKFWQGYIVDRNRCSLGRRPHHPIRPAVSGWPDGFVTVSADRGGGSGSRIAGCPVRLGLLNG